MCAQVHGSICSFYSLIELAITVSKNQNKTSGAASSRGYKSGGGSGGAMKMSQSEILKDSVSAWSINMPGVSKKTRGNGRNGTEQRALEGMHNNSKWRAIGYFAGVKCCVFIAKRQMVGDNVSINVSLQTKYVMNHWKILNETCKNVITSDMSTILIEFGDRLI